MVVCFFFSSRRRHTRWTGDWSSDVCSSDLEMQRRRGRQQAYNEAHDITPRSIVKSVDQVRFTTRVADAKTAKAVGPALRRPVDAREREALIRLLETQMQAAAEELDFELAAVLRDQLLELKAEGDAAHHAPPRE